MPGGKCKFNDFWLSDGNFQKWLLPVKGNVYQGYCKICSSKFDVSHSGISCVRSHAKGSKHISRVEALVEGQQKTISFEKPGESSTVNNESEVAIPSVSKISDAGPSKEITKFMLPEQVTKSEIYWALQVVLMHTSSRSGGSSSDIFKLMFPDSIIAEKFRMHKDKLSYVITYGLGPYFQEQLTNTVRKCDFFCLSLDESLNKIAQKGQMDIIVRFFDDSKNKVMTQYLSSLFLGHCTAFNLLESFKHCLHNLGLPISKIIQVETDGPNVNLKFLKDFNEHLQIEKSNVLLDVGTCSLHILNGCYKTALSKSEWEINDFLRSAYYLFHDFPSRRADYQHLSGSSLFPLKLCTIRWVENSAVLERAINILPHLRNYIKGIKDNPPNAKNFETIQKFLDDDLLLCRLHFLQSITSELETFLKFFQSDKPLVPHLYEELAILFQSLASRFIKRKVLSVQNLRDMLTIDLDDNENYLPRKNIDVGFGASSACSKLTEANKHTFLTECRVFLKNILTKLKIKSPLTKKLVKGLSCLSPQVMLSSDSIKSYRISLALEEFVEKKHLSPIEADSVKKIYLALCGDEIIKRKLEVYDIKKDRLDEFLIENVFKKVDKDSPLLTFVKKALTMFHGNAAVERSFSVNKKCLVENLETESLIAQRLVHSAICIYGGVEHVPITKQMLMAVKNSSRMRNEALEQKKNKRAN